MQCFSAIYRLVLSALYPQQLQLVVCGPLSSGKSSFVRLLAGKQFEENTVPTDNCDKRSFVLENIAVSCFDFGGQTRFQKLWCEHFSSKKSKSPDPSGTILVYVIDYSEYLLRNSHQVLLRSFSNCRRQLKKLILATLDSKTPILILGNKLDLVIERTQSNERLAKGAKKSPVQDTSTNNRALSAASTIANAGTVSSTGAATIVSLKSLKKNDTASFHSASSSHNSIHSNALLHKNTVKKYYRNSRKYSVLFLPDSISVADFAQNLDIRIDEEQNRMYLKLSQHDFLEDEELFRLCLEKNVFEGPSFQKIHDVPANYNQEVFLDRDFGVMFTSFKTGEGMLEVVQWIVGGN